MMRRISFYGTRDDSFSSSDTAIASFHERYGNEQRVLARGLPYMQYGTTAMVGAADKSNR